MNDLELQLHYPLGDALPESGRCIEVAPGVVCEIRLVRAVGVHQVDLGGATVTVLVNWRSEGVYLAVTDDGGTGDTPLIASDGSGMGLLGMRERAALFGGTLTAEPTATGGFQVQLFLPLAS